jgi:hypothetical protein
MKQEIPLKTMGTVSRSCLVLVTVLGAAWGARAQEAKASYPSMAPLEQYLMEDRAAEIAMAQSAAPAAIAKDADVMVLERHGYETVVKGKNGFVCMVERSWTAGFDFPEFWNPKLRGPICFNAAAARTYLPLTIKKTEWALAGLSRTQIADNLKTALDKKELPSLEPGAMCYMLSKQGYLNDEVGHWHPHLMFFIPHVGAETWGANLPDSPILGEEVESDRLTIFMVPLDKWSDGSDASQHDH